MKPKDNSQLDKLPGHLPVAMQTVPLTDYSGQPLYASPEMSDELSQKFRTVRFGLGSSDAHFDYTKKKQNHCHQARFLDSKLSKLLFVDGFCSLRTPLGSLQHCTPPLPRLVAGLRGRRKGRDMEKEEKGMIPENGRLKGERTRFASDRMEFTLNLDGIGPEPGLEKLPLPASRGYRIWNP